MNSWERREYFDFFKSSDIPQYSVTLNLDVTNFYRFVKENKISFFCAFVYAATSVMMKNEPFCYRIRGGEVLVFDDIIPSFTFLNKGELLFKMVTVPISGDILSYARSAHKQAVEQDYHLPKTYTEDTENYVYITSLPWITYTECQMEGLIDKDDAIPRLCIGKFFKDNNGSLQMPFTVRVNHRLVNGYDLSFYFKELQEYLNNL